MTRFSDKTYSDIPSLQRQFGGFATFGSPHKGAPIIANITTIEDYLNETCLVMGKPFVIEFLNDVESQIQSQIPGWANLLFGNSINSYLNNFRTTATTFYQNSCPVITGLAFDQLRESIAPNIGEELHPDSEFMAKLNTFVTDTPGLAFYGVEDAPVSWREIYSLNNDVNLSDWGEANEDDAYIEQASEISDHLFMQYEYYNLHTVDIGPDYGVSISIPSSVSIDCAMAGGNTYACIADWCEEQNGNYDGSTCILCSVSCQCHQAGGVYNPQTEECIFTNPELAAAYYDAWIWWNDFDRNYRIIFGHLVLEMEQTGSTEYCDCYVNQYDIDNGNQPIEIFEGDCIFFEGDNLNYICISRTVDVYSLVDKEYPGDGVMPAYSARSFPGSEPIGGIEMPGSNHQQLRNDKNTVIEITKMYKGDYGDVFYQYEKE